MNQWSKSSGGSELTSQTRTRKAPLDARQHKRRVGAAALSLSLSLSGMTTLNLITAPAALADPASGPGTLSAATGALSGTIPDGSCRAAIVGIGGGGASSGVSTTSGGYGGAGAKISATVAVLPGQAVTGNVAGGGINNAGGAAGGSGGGGAAGTIPPTGGHRGGGGGGRTDVSIGGKAILVAGGGGGGGAAHQGAPQGNGGAAGTAVSAGTAGAGQDAPNGYDASGSTNTGGRGGTATAGGAGGTNSGGASNNGAAGGGIGVGNGGNGGPDTSFDSSGGGGAGYTGGGGGASTVSDTSSGSGGGGGSSWVVGTSPTVSAPVPTGVAGALGTPAASVTASGAAGSVTIDYLPCQYDLALTKAVSPNPVSVGSTVTWTVSVTNNGPDPMTKGDTIDLADTLPAGPNGPATPAYKVTALAVSGGTNADMDSGAFTCSGVTIGASMPASTNCSRAYSAPAAPGAPSGGVRGLNVGETLTITYQQQIATTATCPSTITNIATVKDRPTTTGTTDITGVIATDTASRSLTIGCPPKLRLVKALSGARHAASDQFVMSISPSGAAPSGANATTAGAGSTVTANTGVTEVASGSPGTAYTFAEAMASGSASGLSQYSGSVSCVNSLSGSSTALPATGSTAVPFTITPTTNDNIVCTLTNAPLPSSLSIVKSTTTTSYGAVGQSIPYSFAVKNTGQTTLNSITVSDPQVSGVTCASTSLAPGASTTCSGTHTVTQADIDNGKIVNTASVTGTPPGGSPIPPVTALPVTTPAAPIASLSIVKKTTTTSVSAVGQSIPYTFDVKNTGTITLNNITINDPQIASVTCAPTSLAPGASATCTGSHVVSQADLDNGKIDNQATVSGTPPGGSPITPVPSNKVSTPAVQSPSMTIVKSSVTTSVNAVNQSIPYTFTVRNTGNVTLTSVTVSDPAVTGVTCLATTLAAGASTTCSGTHLVTQADLNAGSVVNTATVTATPPNGTPLPGTPSNTVTIPAKQSTGLTITKKPNTTSFTSVGQLVSYDFIVKNTGNVTVSSLSVSDPKVPSVTCPVTTLAPGDATTCTGNHTVTQGDIDAGNLVNTASATANSPGGKPIPPVTSNVVTVPSAPNPQLSVEKKAEKVTEVGAVGDEIPYTFTVTNTGNVTMTAIALSDPQVNGLNCSATALKPGTSMTCTGSHIVTQADLDSGSVINTATASGTPPSGSPVTATSNTVTVPAKQVAELVIDKSTSTGTFSAAGEQISYTFVVKNSGNVTVDKIVVDDPLITNVACKETKLAPGDGTECTGTYTTTQTDVVNGKVTNTATVKGVDPVGADIKPATSNTVEVPINPLPSMTIAKTTTATKYDTLGALIPYSFTVKNTGNVALTSVTVSDPKTSGVTCAATSLAIGASTTCTGTHLVTQVDLDAKSVVNTATVSATPPSGNPLAPVSSNTVTVPSDQKPALTIAKSTAKQNYSTLGEAVPYTFTVKNTGNVTVSAVTVTDPKVSGISCTATSLAPGASTTCTGTHTVTQADLDAGKIVNTAAVGGTPPSGVALAPVSSNTVTVPATQNTGLNISKSSTKVSVSTVGDVIPYSFVVTNTGNVTLTSITVSDANATGMTCATTTLAPNQNTTCTASHTVTQADLNAGSVLNSATVTGTPPSGTPLPPKSSNVVTIPASQNPKLSIVKATTTASFSTLGATVPYTFTVKNEGNVSMNDMVVSDPNAAAISCLTNSLAPGASTTCTGTHTVTQDDLNSGAIVNTASVVATPPNGTPTLPISSNTVTIPANQTSSLTITKATTQLAYSAVGQSIPYTFTVKNTGNVTLSALNVTDPNATGISCAATSLLPGSSTTCTGTHSVTQADLDAGSVINTASAVATSPNGTQLSPTPSNTVTVPATQSNGITVVKSSTKTTYAAVGEAVPYEFVVTNTGNVTLTAVSIADPKVTGITCGATTLAPTAQTTCTGTHTVIQADLDAGTLVNTASVVATPPNGTPMSPTPSNTVTLTATQSPAMTVVKATSKANIATVGETIPYTFTVKNTGNVTMTSVSVNDPKAAPVSCPQTTLAPGATTTCTGTHTVTQADLNAGEVQNTASVTGNDPSDTSLAPVPSNTITVPAVQNPSMSVAKATPNANYSVAGEAIPYTFTVTNTGNVSLTAVAVNDPKVSPITCPTTNLAPGESTICSGTRIATQGDVDAGAIINTASGIGTPPSGTPMAPTNSNTVTIPAVQNGTLSIVKSSSTPNYSSVGQLVSYSFIVENTGNVTVTALSVTDPNVSGVACPVVVLAPNESTTCTATHAVTQADLDAGTIVNTAEAVATPPSGTPLAPVQSNTVTVPALAQPSLDVVKATSIPSYAVPGFSIPYTFVVKNTGNVTLTSVGVNDPIVGAITCVATTLAPGASTDCAGTYVTTQADVDAGAIINKASANGVDPKGSTVAKDSNIITVPAVQTPNLTIAKATTKSTFSAVGELISYTFTVTNNGNVTMTSVSVNDPIAGPVNCSPTTLAPAAVATCTATRAATQNDLDSGAVVNTATVVGTPPSGTPIAPIGSNIVTVPATQKPGLTIAKSTADTTYNDVGDVLTYSFSVTNTGNVTISDVTVTDAQTGPVTCAATSLAPGASTTCSATHTVTQADLDAGSVVNTASVKGITPQGVPTSPVSSNPVTVPATQSPSLSIAKSASVTTYANAGEVVTYNFAVLNTGNVTITNVVVNDPKVAGLTCSPTTLLPGDSATCSGTHTVSQAEVDAGQIDNVATVTGTPPSGTPIPEVSSNPVTITSVQTPSVTITKVADKSSVSTINENVTYTFTVKNTGNVTLTAVKVNDPIVSGPVNCAATVLAPGATTTCTGTHLVTPNELDKGQVENTADVVATPPSTTDVTAQSNTVIIPATQTPSLSIVKRGTLGSFDSLGQNIPYVFDVENTGNVTISGITVADPGTAGVTCVPDVLSAGERATCTGIHVVTQGDLDSGSYVNTASVTGSPAGGTITPATSNTVTVPAIQNPLLSIVKSSSEFSYSSVGFVVPFEFTVTNTGTVTLTNVIVVDPNVTNIVCKASTLAPAESMSCTAEHTITQADLDNGQLINQAKVIGTPPNPDATVEVPSNTVIIPATVNPLLSQRKAVDPTAAPIRAGDLVPYTVTVSNDGNVTMSLLQVNDPQIPILTCPTSVLAPGEVTVCSGTHATTQAEVDAGQIVNTAFVHAKPPHLPPLTPVATNTIVVPIPATSSLSVKKETSTKTYSTVNVAVPYTFVIENTGNTTLSNIALTDGLLSGISCQASTLAPGASTTCTGTHTITQADLDSGSVINTASVRGTDPGNNPISTNSNTVTITAAQSPSLIITKRTPTANVATTGTVIPYTFDVQNNGNVTLTGVVMDDPNATGETCPTTPLAPGASMTCTAQHTVTQADLDAGAVTNTASVVGTPPTGTMQPSSSNTVDVPVVIGPKVSITKAATESTYTNPGDVVHYTFVVKNNGNVTLSALVVDDPLLSGVSCDATTLAPTDSTNCRGQRAVTQDDIDRGLVVNVATVSATTPKGAPVGPTPSNEVTVTGTQAPALTIEKKALVSSVDSLADEIPYEFLVTNTGNNTIRGLTVIDPIVSGITCPQTTLAPGASTTCTGSHQVTQTDLNAGKVTNTASVTGNRPNGTSLPNIPSNQVVVPATPLPKLLVVKSSTAGSYSAVGEKVPYNFTITNVGNVTMSNIAVADPQITSGLSCPQTTLNPTESTVCVGTHTVTQTDVDAGAIINTATVSADTPNNTPFPSVPSNTVTIPVEVLSDLTITKASPTAQFSAIGDVVKYTFTVTNNGNQTLTNVTVTDGNTTTVTCDSTTLTPKASTSCAATHVVTQGDLDAGVVNNTASVTARTPNGSTTPPSTSNKVSVPAAPAPSFSAVKAAVTPAAPAKAGDLVKYTITVINTGNVTLSGVAVSDAQLPDLACPVATLAPSASTTCTGSHQVTQTEVDAGVVNNTASVVASPPQGKPLAPVPTNTVKVPVVPAPALTLRKATPVINFTAPGQTIPYTFVIRNTGNVTLAGVTLTDPLLTNVSCPAAVLAPGASLTCTGSHVTTQGDVDNGSVVNTASVDAKTPAGASINAPSNTVSVPAVTNAALSIVKSSTTTSIKKVGESVPYSFVVTNTGTVSLTSVKVGDPKIGALTCPATTLAPKATMTCTATYVVTQADVDAGSIVNVATVTGVKPDGIGTSPVGSNAVIIPVDQQPKLSIVKQARVTYFKDLGEAVPYTFLVTNEGNVTLSGIAVGDPITDPVKCTKEILAPGESMTCAATHRVNASDVAAKSLTNTASAIASLPSGARIPDVKSNTVVVPMFVPATTTIAPSTTAPATTAPVVTVPVVVVPVVVVPATSVAPAPSAPSAPSTTSVVAPTTVAPTTTVTPTTAPANIAKPSIALSKTVSGTLARVGDVLTYTFVVTNDGNTALEKVAIVDTMKGLSAVHCGSFNGNLPVGESVTCTAKYTVTLADLARGEIINTAKAEGVSDGKKGPVSSVLGNATARLSVSTPTPLPFTGANSKALAMAGLMLITFGGVLVLTLRRRRED